MNNKIRYSFSGHESFYCKSLWLKKGYDFIVSGKDFNASESVINLGVGKNMVASIRFWLRAFGLYQDDQITHIANYIFDAEIGKDPFLEDIGTLWLLHYLLIRTEFASIYTLFFSDFQKERNNEFSREQLQLFLKRKNAETAYAHLYNENTVKRDIGVLLQNYVTPLQSKSNEDYSALFLDLNLIKQVDSKTYYFNSKGKDEIAPDIFLYSIIKDKGDSKIVSFDSLMELALIFCLTKTELIDLILVLVKKYPDKLSYTDDGGIKQLFFIEEINSEEVLNNYYN